MNDREAKKLIAHMLGEPVRIYRHLGFAGFEHLKRVCTQLEGTAQIIRFGDSSPMDQGMWRVERHICYHTNEGFSSIASMEFYEGDRIHVVTKRILMGAAIMLELVDG